MPDINIENVYLTINAPGASLIESTLREIQTELAKQQEILVETLSLQAPAKAPLASPEPVTEDSSATPQPTVKQVLRRLRLMDIYRRMGCSEDFISRVVLK